MSPIDSQAPPLDSPPNPIQTPASRRVPVLLILTWLVVFGLNLLVPLFFGWAHTEHHGRIGMFATVLTFGIGGCLLACRRPDTIRLINTGGILVALSQIVPILQLYAGMLAFATTESIGLLDQYPQFRGPAPTSEFSGVVLTVLTGIPLLVVAWILGIFVCLFTPRKYWEPQKTTGTTQHQHTPKQTNILG